MFKTEQEIQTNYEILIDEFENKIKVVKAKIDRFSFLRVALLLAEVLVFVVFVSVTNELVILIAGFCLLLPIIIFIAVVKKQQVLEKEEAYLKNLLWVYQNEVAVSTGNGNGYDEGTSFEDDSHPYLADLDVFGKSSLFALINRCATYEGIEKLSNHLSQENNKVAILERQVAVREIFSEIESTFGFRANLKMHRTNKIAEIKYKLKEQLAKQLKFTQGRFLKLYVKITPVVTITLFLAAVVVGGKLWSVLSLLVLVNAAVTFYYMKRINMLYYGFSGSAALLNDYGTAIAWTEEREWKSDYIIALFDSKEKVSLQIKKLAKIIQAFDVRLNILLSAVLNFFFLWDLRCCIKIDQWHQTAASKVENGLDRIGSFEELISIATLTFNHPTWTFPEIVDDFSFSSTFMGHPLIPPPKRIDNHFEFMGQPTVDIITGSNMAGKSTFLRTIGVNMVLAYLGAPVCASKMTLSIFRLLTYMRIKDSLHERTSTFKAELNRLKMILTQVALHENSLVLIDEMLRGTNSKDKLMGSKVFIERLIDLHRPTLFATHDLQLSELKDIYDAAVRNFHFDIQINNGEMDFDYKLKDGPCTIFNAAILLKEIGLSLDN
ncbi:MutS-related protein [Pedobacter insulae]|uniref:MutS domain V n=1 Tax=Pedobacter insulae TaxID=414048 RepID=A0A1I2W2C4_9SPHI|nr:DNA mismatch repair protein MutS [Pedobacter insulae]SFG94819.1 MutS domain V [Pedobacter insulae]